MSPRFAAQPGVRAEAFHRRFTRDILAGRTPTIRAADIVTDTLAAPTSCLRYGPIRIGP